jgi:two-component system cell cycle sensor histidine kinase/response regulator CckA
VYYYFWYLAFWDSEIGMLMESSEEISSAFGFLDRSGAAHQIGEIFQGLIEQCSGSAFVTDSEFRILAGNLSGLQLLKVSGSRGRSVFEFLGAEQAAEVRRAADRALEGSKGATLDGLLDRVSAAPFKPEWRVSPIWSRNREPMAFLLRLDERSPLIQPETELESLALSLSSRVLAEGELPQVNETLRAVLEATPGAVVAVDSQERIFRWNSAAEKLFGWGKSEVSGRTVPLELARKPGETLRLYKAVQSGENVSVDALQRRKGGTLCEVSVSVAGLRSPEGAICGAVAVITDVTDRKRLSDQLRQAQKMEAVGRLAGGIAHDFNNLLTVITGYDEMLLSVLSQNARARGYAVEIQQAAEKASALTKQLLAFGRRQVGCPELIDINPIVSNMGNMVRRLIGEDIELVLALAQTPAMVRADSSQIEQIILNLVVNARDAMTQGGRITVESSLAELGEEYVQTHLDVEPGRYVCISVTDTGQGMSQKLQSHIFEPFFTTKSQGEGTGLGLSTIYGIVKQSRGSIWVYSEPGKGSTFKIYLPAADGASEAPSGCGAVLATGNETILVVEDESGLREMVEQLLEDQGYEVLSAANSYEATQVCSMHRGPIDLLLTDVVMPKTNGPELARRLSELRRRMRILYMSGYPSETITRHGVLGSGAAFLEKPFTPETLARKVRSVLDGPPVGVL